MKRNITLFTILFLLILFFLILDISLGSVSIQMSEIFDILLGRNTDPGNSYIILNFRFPKVLTALFVGAGISVCGLQMQTLFRNPLADTSILGIGSGASLGVGLFVMLAALFPGAIPASISSNYWGMIISAIAGALLILLLVSTIITWLNDIVSILIIGVMFGFVTSSVVSIMQYFSDPEIVKNYLIWSFGSLSGTTWTQLKYMVPVVSVGLFLSCLMPKYMNALLLGENYAKSVGIDIFKVRILLVLLTAFITGTLTAFTGPIAFLGIAIPHCARMLFRTTNHRILIPASMMCGMSITLLCDIITQLPGGGIILPINAVTSILGAPVVIFIIIKRRRSKTIFN